MALTRRTPAFAQLAHRTEQLLEGHGARAGAGQVDAVINYRVEQVAARMGVTARTALRYAPADLPETTAALMLEVLAQDERSAAPVTRRHLRLVAPASGSPAATDR